MQEVLVVTIIAGCFIGFWPLVYGTNHNLTGIGFICFAATIFASVLGGLLLCVPVACICIWILKSCEKSNKKTNDK